MTLKAWMRPLGKAMERITEREIWQYNPDRRHPFNVYYRGNSMLKIDFARAGCPVSILSRLGLSQPISMVKTNPEEVKQGMPDRKKNLKNI